MRRKNIADLLGNPEHRMKAEQRLLKNGSDTASPDILQTARWRANQFLPLEENFAMNLRVRWEKAQQSGGECALPRARFSEYAQSFSRLQLKRDVCKRLPAVHRPRMVSYS